MERQVIRSMWQTRKHKDSNETIEYRHSWN